MIRILQQFLLATLLLGILTGAAVAQSTTSRKARKAWDKAQKHKQARNFDKAIEELEKAVEADQDFVAAHYDLAYNHYILRHDAKSRYHFEKVVELAQDGRRYQVAWIRVADYKLAEGEYDRARELAQQFLDFDPSARLRPDISRAKEIIGIADFAREGMKHPVIFEPRLLPKTVNHLQQQYFPVLTADRKQLYFTGKGNADENIFLSEFVGGEWSVPERVKELNTPSNEGTCTISADGKVLIFTVCEGASRPILGLCDLFVSYKTGDKWSKPMNMGDRVNSRAWESQPTLSADGRTLYFVSDRGGGQGRNDIWVTTRNDKGEWQTPRNLGITINTSRDEISPFIHANGRTLYFSSQGHQGYGGYDLFKSEWGQNGWGEPKNLGYPLNNHNGQVALFITADNKKGYYSDEKMDGNKIVSRLAEFDIPDEIKPDRSSDFVFGKVYDSKNREVLQASINLTDLATEEVISSVTSDPVNGNYLIVLTEGAEYALHVARPGYLYQSLTFNYAEGGSNQEIEKDIYLDPITKGSVSRLNNIFFESGSYALLPKSRTELNKLTSFMQLNPKVRIEISGHTDNVGSDKSNEELSMQRAKAVVDFMISAGVPRQRLEFKGYGETRPVADNDSDANRALNRRIEFSIL